MKQRDVGDLRSGQLRKSEFIDSAEDLTGRSRKTPESSHPDLRRRSGAGDRPSACPR